MWMDWWIGFQLWFILCSFHLLYFLDRWLACILYSSICCPKPPVWEIFCTFPQFIYLDLTNSMPTILRSFASPFFLGLADTILDEFSVFTLTIWSSFRFTGASLNWIQFSHVPLSTAINVSLMHCYSINARKLVIWFRHGSISSSLLSLWRSSKSCYNIAFAAFVVASPLLCTYKYIFR